MALLKMLILLTLANASPVVAKKIFGRRLARPLDFGRRFLDGRPLLGPSKTIRGILVSLIVTAAAAPILGLAPTIGLLVAGTAMAGDLCSSFLKRRIGFATSSRALFLDQIPESLIPLLACAKELSLSTLEITLGVAIFFFGEIVSSRLLYLVRLRDEPY